MDRRTRNVLIAFTGLIAATMLVTACASVISQSTLDRVDRTIAFQEIQGDPERFVGKTVLLGGVIVTTDVKKEATWVEVVQKPLDWEKMPEDTDLSYGRFLVLFDGFMDPAIYARGRKITVAGDVQGKKVLPIMEIHYTYPVIVPREHHVWTDAETDGGPRFSIGIGVGGVFR
jgi:outer membrane lipoprotein